MTRVEALAQHDLCLSETTSKRPQLLAQSFTTMTRSEPRDWGDSWVFIYLDEGAPQGEFEAVVVPKDDSEAQLVFGAIGKVFRNERAELGLPRSSERWLASGPGRYQLFTRGLAVWDELPNRGYSRPASWLSRRASTRCVAAVAFMDLRGFTEWARPPRDASAIQDLMAKLEDVLQDTFLQGEWKLVFVKGLGDGAMILVEEEWYIGPVVPTRSAAHACAFLKACARYVRRASTAIPEGLAVGCGIESGEVLKTFLFGQTDYLGAPINVAAKLQQLAWNELIAGPILEGLVSTRDPECLHLMMGKRLLAKRGARIDVERTDHP